MSKKSDLNEAISEAHLLLEEIDNFDLHSEDAVSAGEFAALEKLHNESVAKVISLAKEY